MSTPIENVGATSSQESFTSALDIVKLYTTLSTGALAFSIGLTSQSTNNYPGRFRTMIIAGWFVFFGAILSGVWAQAVAPRLIKAKKADPNNPSFRGAALLSVVLFVVGIALLGVVLARTAPLGPAGQHLAIESPVAALATALKGLDRRAVTKVVATEYLKGVDPVRPDEGAWHVQLEVGTVKAGSTATLDVYVDPVAGCTFIVQRPRGSSGPPCMGL